MLCSRRRSRTSAGVERRGCAASPEAGTETLAAAVGSRLREFVGLYYEGEPLEAFDVVVRTRRRGHSHFGVDHSAVGVVRGGLGGKHDRVRLEQTLRGAQLE